MRYWASRVLPLVASAANSVEIGAAKEVAAGAADKLAPAVLEARGAGGAEDGVVFGRNRAHGGFGGKIGVGRLGLHRDSVAHGTKFSSNIFCAFAAIGASNGIPSLGQDFQNVKFLETRTKEKRNGS